MSAVPSPSHRQRPPVWRKLPRAAALGAAALALLLLLLPATAGAQSEDERLPLPTWNLPTPAPGTNTELGAQFNNLLPPPDEILTRLDTGPRLADGPPTLLQGYGEMGPRDLSLFLRGSILDEGAKPAAAAPRPTPVMSLRDVPADVLKQANDAPASDHLLDPQGLVPEMPREDVERLLAFHNNESRVRLYILVLEAGQKLPDGVNLDGTAHGALTHQHACLAILPLGEPWRARFLVSKSVQQAVPAARLAEVAEDCIKDTLIAADPAQQLQRLGVRLSTQMFRLESLLTPRSATAGAPGSEPLSEVSPAAGAAAVGGGSGRTSPWVLWSLALLGVLALVGVALHSHLLLRLRRLRKPQAHVWVLPETDVTPRLGGAFSGGTGAMVHYKH